MTQASVRATTVEGIFYPSDPAELEAEVARRLAESPVEPATPVAVVAPHAALEYAGDTIAAAFRAASGRRNISNIVILAPIHRDPPPGFILPESASYQCPLGDVRVDREKVEDLLGCGTVFTMNDIPHLEEHSIEVLLPFLRRVFPEAGIVPVLTGKAGRRSVLALSRALELLFTPLIDRTLFVVSSNAATAFPRGKGTVEEADRFLELAGERRWKELLDESDRGRISCCGSRALASVLAFGNIALTVRIIARSCSTDEAGGRAVHYAAVSM